MDGGPSARRRHDQVLADVARFAGSSLELEEVLERIVEGAAALTGADRASILLIDRSGRRLLPSALWGMDAAFTADWKTRPIWLEREPLSREALATGTTVTVVDAAADPRTDKESVAFFGDQSILVAPLSRRGRQLGTLFLNHVRERYAFTPDDLETTAVIASQAAIAIDNARLYGDTRRQAEQLQRSFRYAGEALAAGVDLQSTLQFMVQLAVETAGAGGGSLHLLDEGGRSTYLVVSTGDAPAAGIEHQEFPLVSDGHLLGSLALWRDAPPFDAKEHELLASFAGHARIAIEHARLYARLQEEQRRASLAERSQADFVSMVSHELRTPLALVKAYAATLLQVGLPIPEERRHRFLEGIATATDRLQGLIDNLLSATSLDAGLFISQPAPLEVGALLREALGEVAFLAVERRVGLELEPQALWVLGDRQQLRQVVENLITNAVKYTPTDSPLTVLAAGTERTVRITVADSGPGIPPNALELIFEKFYRVPVRDSTASGPEDGARPPEATSGRPGGMGLGLYICRRIVEAHGGRIWAENPQGGGAAFHVDLPRSVGAAPGARRASDARSE
ncbi:MAG TPA: ATP-binding protein [Chloroflexota bacterium]|nr:ATP-binding protein [Chloroflexota bacterium]